ncbi:zinc finger CCCH domain-containing protein 18-like [Haliotis cracherodii]|uniref:zinc finger CCCH domain-containing protein 18-like n=1 Tax=Haliotis cracherodii TaxID=6455 RepID=UPI0039EB056E
MEAVELMEQSPENVTEQDKDGEAIDIDALIPDKSPSSGPQSDYGYDEEYPKSQESMITDAQSAELNENEASVEESDSEESPESPPAQYASPMEHEFPVVVEQQQPLNIRSPVDMQQGERPISPSPDHGEESPGSPQELQTETSSHLHEASDAMEDKEDTQGSEQGEASSVQEEGDSVQNTWGDDTPASPEPSSMTENDSEVYPQQEDLGADSTVDQEDAIATSFAQIEDGQHADSSGHISSPLSPSTDKVSEAVAEYQNKEQCDSKEEEDLYSLDLMEGNTEQSEDGVCDSAVSCREAMARDSDDSVRESESSPHDDKHSLPQVDADSKVSQSIDKPQIFSESDVSVPIVHSSVVTSSPRASIEHSSAPSNDTSGSSEVSQSNIDPESDVHSSRDPEKDILRNISVESVDALRKFEDIGENRNSSAIPNGHDISPVHRDSDKAGKVQSNTSFNEEHVELDYDEEEGDDMHGHANDSKEAGEDEDRQKDGDEKQDGELSSSDDEKDDGELEDDEDCEEGEIREPGGRRPFVKPICRFFTKGNCTWGNNCRFLHPGINDKGNYRLFEPPGYNGGVLGRLGPTWGPEPGIEPELPPPPPEPPATESAWERGLRHAKEMRKKANMRKEQETNFEEKRMNLSLDEEREVNKENERNKYVKDPYYDQYDDEEYYGKSQVHGWQAGSYENFEVRWTREQEFSPYRHEKERERFKERRYSPPLDRIERLERQMFDTPPRTRDERRDKYRDNRMEPPPPTQMPRGRADEWHDPWQRSKSPKQKRRSSRSHSRGRRRRRSYSVSSHSSSSYSSSRSRSSSFSSRSSRSSYSRSSSFSSRSPSPRPVGSRKSGPPPPEKKQLPPSKSSTGRKGPTSDERKVPPPSKNSDQPRSAVTVKSKQRSPDKRAPGPTGPPGKPGRPGPMMEDRGRRRDKPPHLPAPRPMPRAGSRSSSGSSLSRSRSSSSSSFSRSGSGSSGSSRSRSRSSSTSSSGSADSEHLYRDLPGSNRPVSPKKKVMTKDKRVDKPPSKHNEPHPPRRRDVDRERERERDRDRDRGDDRMSRQDGRSGVRGKGPPPSRQPTTPVKPKDPLKLVGQKSNIKLTLLNKPADKPIGGPGPGPSAAKRRQSDSAAGPPSKRQAIISPPPAKAASGEKQKVPSRPEKMKSPPKDKPISPTKAPSKPLVAAAKAAPSGKGAPAPVVPPPLPTPPVPAVKQKKSMSSRREELLKQLKAVEDAIARKKAKMQ